MNAFLSALKSFSNELTKPNSYRKGENFENYIRQYTFNSKYYKLISKTRDYISNKRDYESRSVDPDFLFECIKTKRNFMLLIYLIKLQSFRYLRRFT